MFDPLTAGEGVEGDVQDVVGFMIGKMHLKEMKIGVDVADQAYPVPHKSSMRPMPPALRP